MKEVRSFHVRIPSAVFGANQECTDVAKKESKSKELQAAAKLRLKDFLSASYGDTGAELTPELRDDIKTVINSVRKTYRYMLFVGLLVSVADENRHPRCLQLKAKCQGAFDARTLCKSVVVPFEKELLKGRLGGSCDPYVSNPARLPMVEKNNDTRSVLDKDHLSRLYDVLEYAKNSPLVVRKRLFRYAYSCVLQRPALESSVLDFDVVTNQGLRTDPFFDFLEAHTEGASAVAVLAAFFRRFYGKGTEVDVHPLTESGASSNEVGDIDLRLKDGQSYAVEVKAKPYTNVDVNHACEKALKAQVKRVIFAYGPDAAKSRPQDGVLKNLWEEKGIELTFMSIDSALGVAMAASDVKIRIEMANEMSKALVEMNATDSVKALFKKLFEEQEENAQEV